MSRQACDAENLLESVIEERAQIADTGGPSVLWLREDPLIAKALIIDIENDRHAPRVSLSVRKREGKLEPFNLEKILKAVTHSGNGSSNIDQSRVAANTIGGL
jgi:hypothetical protein